MPENIFSDFLLLIQLLFLSCVCPPERNTASVSTWIHQPARNAVLFRNVRNFRFFFFTDFSALPTERRLLTSLFQSVTPRTAGFNTVALPAMSSASQGLMVLLMLIGGSPGSTAGGIKTTTLAVLLANAAATFRQCENAQLFGRRIDCSTIKTATTILTMYLTLFFGGAVFISTYENLPLVSCLFETASAVGTVGLTLGITPQLHIPSQIVLITLMYLGRVGGLTLIYAALSGEKTINARLPLEKITTG